jgi:hypothetical protein
LNRKKTSWKWVSELLKSLNAAWVSSSAKTEFQENLWRASLKRWKFRSE